LRGGFCFAPALATACYDPFGSAALRSGQPFGPSFSDLMWL
jgi:hypothetical protein